MALDSAARVPISRRMVGFDIVNSDRALPLLWAAFLTLVVAAPWLLPGYLFGTDWPVFRLQADQPTFVETITAGDGPLGGLPAAERELVAVHEIRMLEQHVGRLEFTRVNANTRVRANPPVRVGRDLQRVEAGEEDVIRKLFSDLTAAGLDIDEAVVRRAIEEQTIEARRQLMQSE